MFWLIIGIFIIPIVMLGIITDKKRSNRVNSNPNQNKSSHSETDYRKDYTIGENIRGE
ncbi:hypothetical protein [Virgibacillus oceani]|uniref:Uncharacterized protein n=1 Tax=Virgibacillus oceani TaxID=1479511 RepID=A0A917HJ20_9BACI|nr:hypothetical protein [Virgibacillus oceani]GGG81160.1 hypothetical protein GCM10011398_28210 [Virgibacillus oceani]